MPAANPNQIFDHSVLISTALVMRDGDAAQRNEHEAWANAQFQAAIARSEDPVHRHRSGVQFNPVGIAAVGMIAAVKQGGGLSDVRRLSTSPLGAIRFCKTFAIIGTGP